MTAIYRWTPKRKAALLDDLCNGITTEADLMKLEGIGPEELAEWRKLYTAHGVGGLRSTRLMMYRSRRRTA